MGNQRYSDLVHPILRRKNNVAFVTARGAHAYMPPATALSGQSWTGTVAAYFPRPSQDGKLSVSRMPNSRGAWVKATSPARVRFGQYSSGSVTGALEICLREHTLVRHSLGATATQLLLLSPEATGSAWVLLVWCSVQVGHTTSSSTVSAEVPAHH